MEKRLINFIRAKQIDSFVKLRLLLFLHQYPHLGGVQELVERLYLEAPLAERLIAELQTVGLLKGKQNNYYLPDEPNLRSCLESLTCTFEHPLTRQELLEQIKFFSSRELRQNDTFPSKASYTT